MHNWDIDAAWRTYFSQGIIVPNNTVHSLPSVDTIAALKYYLIRALFTIPLKENLNFIQ